MTVQTTVSAQSAEDDATRPLSASLIGTVIDGRYRVESILGVGGVGVVYGAQRVDLEMGVALKVLRSGVDSLPLVLKRFEREAKVLASLSHPHIVALTDYGIHDGAPYLVMERLEGESLEEHVLSEGPLEPERALEIFREVLRGLAYAHERSVLHRDLKPGNIFLQTLPDEPAHAKLLDFGLAKIIDPEADLDGQPEDPTVTRAGTVLGTPAYMAPEQASGSRVDARADVYAAGILLFELLTGTQPFVADRRTDLLAKHLLEPVPDPNMIRRGLRVGDELAAFLLRAMAKDPGGRFADAREMVVAFDALPETPLSYTAPSNPEVTREFPLAPSYLADRGQSGSEEAAKRRRLVVAAAVVALVALMLGIWWSGRAEEQRSAAQSVARPQDSAEGVATVPSTNAIEPPQTAAVEPPQTAARNSAQNSAQNTLVPPEPTRPEANALPEELQGLFERLNTSEGVDREAHRAVRLYQRLHPEDPRPSLMLAANLADHESWVAAVERYGMILERWPHVGDEGRVPRDLVAAAMRPRTHDEATTLLMRIDGERVTREIDALRALSENRTERAALASLRRQFAP